MNNMPEPRKDLTAVDAKFEAQKLSFAPVAFQCARVLRETGILKAVADAGDAGISVEDISNQTGISAYGVRVLLDMGASLYLVDYRGDAFVLMKTGYFMLHDEMTRVNMDFIHDVCYKGLFFLEESIREERPAGLDVFGKWNTIYEALAELPEQVRKSWFAFDHYYSDNAFPTALKLIFDENPPRRLFDVGGNTGRWALQCVQYNPDVEVTILDLPGQLRDAAQNAREHGVENRIHGHVINLLNAHDQFPQGADAIWMSQFLDCFSEQEILSILQRAAASMSENTRLYINETYWDRQRFEAATYSLNATSLYFTAMANGNSRMYHSRDMIRLVHRAGLIVDKDVDHIGMGHTIFRCRLA
ncbi:MAG: methyltransferase domain-containing protein [Cryomorphaceae bacterium]|nr:MAG: methyltransferase domain-containing protein [Cryomorphaceae bacterium]